MTINRLSSSALGFQRSDTKTDSERKSNALSLLILFNGNSYIGWVK